MSEIRYRSCHMSGVPASQLVHLVAMLDAKVLELATPIDNVTEHQGLGIGEAYIRAKMAQVCKSGWQLQSREVDNNWVTRYEYRLKAECLVQKRGDRQS